MRESKVRLRFPRKYWCQMALFSLVDLQCGVLKTLQCAVILQAGHPQEMATRHQKSALMLDDRAHRLIPVAVM